MFKPDLIAKKQTKNMDKDKDKNRIEYDFYDPAD